MANGAGNAARGARKRWRQKGLLTALGLVFAVSAVLRIGALDLAFAQSEPTATPTATSAPPTSSSPLRSAPLVTALAEVEALRDRLAAREAGLVDRERAVAAAQVLVETRLTELAAAEARLTDLVAVSDSAAESDLDRLTRVYETMPPEQAAPLFAQMSPSFAAGFMSRMTPATSAALMAELDPEIAYGISVVIATRNATAPTLPAATDAEDTEN